MRPVSQKFLNALRGSHSVVSQAFVVAAGQTGVSPVGTEIPILSGNIALDASAAIRGTLDMDTLGKFPDNADDNFAPYGNEVFVRRGIVFGGGSTEFVSFGYFRIHSVEQNSAPLGSLRIAAQDRMAGIVKARLLNPKQFTATTTYGSVVSQLVQEVYPWATIQWDDSQRLNPIARSLIAEEERFDFLDDLVKSLGKIWYWDHRGILVIKNQPSAANPVWSVNAGANGVQLSLSRELSREGVYNGVKASGEGLDTATPASASVVDNNPSSPTYWYGDFGKEPMYYSSPFITTNAQAKTAATAILKTHLGLPYSVDFTSVVNPALEPWDAVSVTALNEKSQTHVLENITIPLSADQAMTAATREQTLVVIGDA